MTDTAASEIWGARLCWTGIALCGLALVLIVVSGPGHRFGFLPLGPAFLVYAGAVLALVVALAAGIGGLGLTRGSGGGSPVVLVWGSVILAAFLSWNNFGWLQKARSVPPIHDITTDTVNPPQFVDVLPLRADAPNPPEYAGAEIADQQIAAFPDIQPIESTRSVADVYVAAVAVVDQLGWDLAGSDESAGRVEATDTTFWFGFKDDVVVRIAATSDGTRVDVRSKSRVGLSDVGTNAERIRTFRDALLASLD